MVFQTSETQDRLLCTIDGPGLLLIIVAVGIRDIAAQRREDHHQGDRGAHRTTFFTQ